MSHSLETSVFCEPVLTREHAEVAADGVLVEGVHDGRLRRGGRYRLSLVFRVRFSTNKKAPLAAADRFVLSPLCFSEEETVCVSRAQMSR